MLNYERRYYQDGFAYVAGVDEAGRGPLAGPVMAAAVIFPPSYENEEINDSKKLSEKKREELYEVILHECLSWSVVSLPPEDIDHLNIYRATQKAMEDALRRLFPKPDLIITDAMPLKNMGALVVPLVKADAKCLNVAAASILAKVTRDRYMMDLDTIYPQYGFKKNKGYGTREHLDALRIYGPIRGVHRFSFEPVSKNAAEQLKLF